MVLWQNNCVRFSFVGAVPHRLIAVLLRSLPTMPLRVREQTATAATLAAFQPDIPALVRYITPGLATHITASGAAADARRFWCDAVV